MSLHDYKILVILIQPHDFELEVKKKRMTANNSLANILRLCYNERR